MSCHDLYRSKWRTGSTIPVLITVDRTEVTYSLVGSQLTFRVSNADLSTLLVKSTAAATIAFTTVAPERLEASGKIYPGELTALERSRFYFALEITLPNGDEIPLTPPGQDWFELYPEVGP